MPRPIRNKRKGVLPDFPAYAPATVFEAILIFGNDRAFEPAIRNDYEPTQAEPGSKEKLEVLAFRAANGLPLWHPQDKTDFSNEPRIPVDVPIP